MTMAIEQIEAPVAGSRTRCLRFIGVPSYGCGRIAKSRAFRNDRARACA